MSDKTKPNSSSTPSTDSRPPEITIGPDLRGGTNSADPTLRGDLRINVKTPNKK